MDGDLEAQERERRNAKVVRSWAQHADRYDKSMDFFERRVFGREHRLWACSRAVGDVLEVAVGTGLNLPLYADDVRLTAIDLSAEMLTIALTRAAELGRDVHLMQEDAHELPFEDGSFDSALCTYSLCNIPDPRRAVGEMGRVLRPGGRLILVDHIRGSVRLMLFIQKAIEFVSARAEGEHMTRRPLDYVRAEGLDVVERDRLGPGGIVERLVAVNPRKIGG